MKAGPSQTQNSTQNSMRNKLSLWLKNRESLYFAVKSFKVKLGAAIFLVFLILGAGAPFLTQHQHDDIVGLSAQSPCTEFLLGTTNIGEDVYTQVLYGLRTTFVIGAVAGILATLIGLSIGFLSGYFGGTFIDELLMMFTNILLVIPVLAILIIISAYLQGVSVLSQSIIIGLFNWPWVARAVRAQTLSIKTNEYVNLSRISSLPVVKILTQDIAANMFSYVFMAFILQFSSSILAAATLDFLGVGPESSISLGLTMRYAILAGAIIHGYWWWAIIPGAVLTLLIISLYLINTGLDEAFNPRLREF